MKELMFKMQKYEMAFICGAFLIVVGMMLVVAEKVLAGQAPV